MVGQSSDPVNRNVHPLVTQFTVRAHFVSQISGSGAAA
jgi:hypothetical protein